MDPVSSQKAFHVHADSRRFWNRISNPFLRAKERRLAERISRLAPGRAARLLEVGCGEGGMLNFLRELRPDLQLVGLDFSQEKLAFLHRYGPTAEAVCADAVRLPFAVNSFDAIVYRDVLHHVNWARRETLVEGLRTLRPHGAIVVIEANGHTMLNRLFQCLYPAERGLRDSTRSKLADLGMELGRANIEFVEASFLVRALGFVVGWPGGLGRLLAWPFYAAARCWEALVERTVPRQGWTYMMMSLHRR